MKKYLLIACTLIILTTFTSCGENSKDNSSMSENSVSEVITESSTDPETIAQDETTEQVTENETEEIIDTTETISEPVTEQEVESEPKSAQAEESKNNDSETENGISGESFVEDVKSVIQGDVGENEFITDVAYQKRQLTVYVDLSQKDPTPLTLEDIALSRNSSITDDILELSQYDDLWDEIIVDFGETGTVVNSKSDIADNGYGRYFDVDKKYLEMWGMVP